jgi:hypothetical protein
MSIERVVFCKEEEDVVSSNSGGSDSGDSHTTTCTKSSSSNEKGKRDEDGDSVGAKSESTAVVRLRVFLITVLFWSTIGVALAVWSYFSMAEVDAFEAQYYQDSAKIFVAVSDTLEVTLGAIDTFLLGIVSLARFSSQEWPFVTVPDYELRVRKIRGLARAAIVTQYHFVTGDQRSDWENYSVTNDQWVEEGLESQKADKNFKGTLLTEYYTRGDIHLNQDPYNAPGPYLVSTYTSASIFHLDEKQDILIHFILLSFVA